MSAVSRRLNDQLPAAARNRAISVVPLSLYLVGPQSRLGLWMLGGTVFCVFLFAAANVTSLSLARSVARARNGGSGCASSECRTDHSTTAYRRRSARRCLGTDWH